MALRTCLRFLGPLLVLVSLSACDKKSTEALMHTEVPTLSVPAQAVSEAPAAVAPVAAGDTVGGLLDEAAVQPPETGSAAANAAAAGPAADGDDESADADARGGRRAQGGASRRRRGASAKATRGVDVGGAAAAPNLTAPLPSKSGERGLGVSRLTLTSKIAQREPVGALSSLRAGQMQKFSTFVELTNESGEASSVTVSLTSDAGGPSHSVTLPVGAERRFRTWANLKAPRQPGGYHVTVRDDHGRTLARSALRVAP